MNFKGLILDIDGVFHNNGKKIKNINNFIKKINIPVLLLTNDCRYSKENIRKNLKNYKINIPNSWDIYNSGYSLFDNIKNNNIVNIIVFGSNHLKNLMSKIKLNKSGDDIIILGILEKKLTDIELNLIINKIKSGSKLFITAIDNFIPPPNHSIAQMPMQIINLIKQKINNINYLFFGKPSLLIKTKISTYFNNIDYNDLLFVGDTLNTDILMANNLKISSLLVLTGSTTQENLKNSDIKPKYILNNITDLILDK